jgi:hypothetical protein
MICPNCNSDRISLWPWYDGGQKGIQCNECGNEYWSDIVSLRIYEEEKKLHELLLAQWDFPPDGCTDNSKMPPYLIDRTTYEAVDRALEAGWDVTTRGGVISCPMDSERKGMITLVYNGDEDRVISFKLDRYEDKPNS